MLRNFLIASFLMLVPKNGMAQVTCHSDLSYKWKQADAQNGAEKTVKWGSFTGQGPDEAAAKAVLGKRLDEEVNKAREACKKEHENLAGCYSVKFAALGSVMQTLNFSGRKAMEEAITADCKKAAGSCLEPISADPVCAAEVKAETTAAAGGEKKEDKGKKKK